MADNKNESTYQTLSQHVRNGGTLSPAQQQALEKAEDKRAKDSKQ